MLGFSGHFSTKSRTYSTTLGALRAERTVPEAAEALAISRSKLYELIAAGLVRSVRIDGSRRVPVEALETYVAHLLDREATPDAKAS
jgi:excisionase family DNA binding protein